MSILVDHGLRQQEHNLNQPLIRKNFVTLEFSICVDFTFRFLVAAVGLRAEVLERPLDLNRHKVPVASM